MWTQKKYSALTRTARSKGDGMCVRLGEWVYSSVPEASSWRESLASQSRREGETNKRQDDSELYRCACVRAYVQTMPLIFAHHLRAVAQKEEQGFQVGGPADYPGAVWVGGCVHAAAVRGTPRVLTRKVKYGVTNELRDEPAHDVCAYHPREAGLEQLDAMVRREGATAVAAVASCSSPCSQKRQNGTGRSSATPERVIGCCCKRTREKQGGDTSGHQKTAGRREQRESGRSSLVFRSISYPRCCCRCCFLAACARRR